MAKRLLKITLAVIACCGTAAAQHAILFGSGGMGGTWGGGVGYIAKAGGYIGGTIVSSSDESVRDPDLRRQFNYELDAGLAKHGSRSGYGIFGIIGVGRATRCIDRVPGSCDTWRPGANREQAYSDSLLTWKERNQITYGAGALFTVGRESGLAVGVRVTNAYAAAMVGLLF